MNRRWTTLSARCLHRGRARRGQSLVEFALVLPVFLLLLVIAIDFGRAYLGWVTLNNVVREAANFAGANPKAWAILPGTNPAGYTALITNEAAGIDCTMPDPLPAPSFPPGPDGQSGVGTPAIVALTCDFTPITPMISSILGGTIPISASAAFPIRNGVIAGVPVGAGSPSIATVLSTPTGTIGVSVHDTATLSGATPNAGGTVTYTVYSDSACTANARTAGTVTVTAGLVPRSSDITFDNAGTYYWQAEYSGDVSNHAATSPCTSEILTVGQNGPSLTTALSQSSILHGTAVNDTAVLSGATSTAGGTVTYTVYSNSSCTQGAQAAGTVSVVGATVPASLAVTFPSAGTYYWQAVYSGDTNNAPATSPCGSEILQVDKQCTVPNLANDKSQNVQADWYNAGFQTTVVFVPVNPPTGTNIKTQSIAKNTTALCVNTPMSVTW
jgi:TadE-like protein